MPPVDLSALTPLTLQEGEVPCAPRYEAGLSLIEGKGAAGGEARSRGRDPRRHEEHAAMAEASKVGEGAEEEERQRPSPGAGSADVVSGVPAEPPLRVAPPAPLKPRPSRAESPAGPAGAHAPAQAKAEGPGNGTSLATGSLVARHRDAIVAAVAGAAKAVASAVLAAPPLARAPEPGAVKPPLPERALAPAPVPKMPAAAAPSPRATERARPEPEPGKLQAADPGLTSAPKGPIESSIAPPSPTPLARSVGPHTDAEAPAPEVRWKAGEAHVSLNTDAGALSLHVRIKDGLTDVVATGPAARQLHDKTPQLQAALSKEGLVLGKFAAHLNRTPEGVSAFDPLACQEPDDDDGTASAEEDDWRLISGERKRMRPGRRLSVKA